MPGTSSGGTVEPAPGRRSPTLIAFLLFVPLCGALFALQIYVLFYQQSGVPSAPRAAQTQPVGEIAGDVVVSQTFGVMAGGLSGLTMAAQPAGQAVEGDVVFTLTEVGDARPAGAVASVPEGFVPRQVAHVVKPAREIVARDTFTIAFTPLEDSHGKQYRLEIQAPDVPAGKGIAVWTSRGQSYLGGVFAVNGKEQWGDLVFWAHAERASVFRRVEYLLQDQPGWLRSRWTLGTLIVLYNWALAAFTWYMLFVDDGPEDVAA
jgi:hypothetical protein